MDYSVAHTLLQLTGAYFQVCGQREGGRFFVERGVFLRVGDGVECVRGVCVFVVFVVLVYDFLYVFFMCVRFLRDFRVLCSVCLCVCVCVCIFLCYSLSARGEQMGNCYGRRSPFFFFADDLGCFLFLLARFYPFPSLLPSLKKEVTPFFFAASDPTFLCFGFAPFFVGVFVGRKRC